MLDYARAYKIARWIEDRATEFHGKNNRDVLAVVRKKFGDDITPANVATVAKMAGIKLIGDGDGIVRPPIDAAIRTLARNLHAIATELNIESVGLSDLITFNQNGKSK